MALFIQKFGGSSVASVDLILERAQRVAKYAKDNQVVVVVSAMHGETDRLLSLFQNHFSAGASREKAMLVSTAEQVCASLFALALQSCGVPAQALTGGQAGILTTLGPLKSDIAGINTERCHALLAQGVVPVVCGYQGINSLGDVTTLGRGGSDLTAVALAHHLRAQECQIFTDVDGIYSADPRVVDDAIRLNTITYSEMLEHSTLGAKVMQRQAVEYGGRFNVPIRVLSSSIEGQGTLIDGDGFFSSEMASKVSGVAFDRYQGRITVRGMTQCQDFEAILRKDLASLSIDIDLLMTHSFDKNEHDIKFTVHLDDFDVALQSVVDLTDQYDCTDITSQRDIAKLSIIGVGMHQHARVASTALEVLSRHQIEVQLLSSSHYKVSVVVAQSQIEMAARLLHASFLI